jgi:hypothetical protein
MTDIANLVHELNAAANKAALCRDIGDYFGATFWEGRCREIDEHIILADRPRNGSVQGGETVAQP